MMSDRELCLYREIYRRTAPGRDAALWCLTKWVDPPVVGYWTEEGATLTLSDPQHEHVCKVDVYRSADHVHECSCGARGSRS